MKFLQKWRVSKYKNIKLNLACANGDIHQVASLLNQKNLFYADIHTGNDYGFLMACQNGHLDVVKYLLTSPDLKEHADIHADDDYGFRYACENDHLEVVKYLLSFNSDKCIDFQNTHYNLDWAIENKYDDVIIVMMKNLKNNHFMEYFECLSKIEEYNKELYEQVKNVEIDNDEISSSPSEIVLFL